MKNKVCIVTGAGGIIGSKIVEKLLAAEARVSAVDLNAESLKKLVDANKNPNLMTLEADITSPENVDSIVSKTVAKWGQIDVLVNNAAAKYSDLKKFFAPLEEYSLEVWKSVMEVNVDGMMLMAQKVGKQMVAQKKGGSIIQTASIYGMVAPDQRIYEGSEYMGVGINTPLVYSASKGAVLAMTKYMSTYWAKDGIRVNTVTPGGVESGQNDTFKRNYSARVPMGRMAKAEEIADAVEFLASDKSTYITGQNIIVDGGLTTW